MNISTKLKINNIAEYIKQNMSLFESFANVYLFGPILNNNVAPNDIDVLLVYSEYCYKIELDSVIIASVLEKKFELPVDLTILNTNEEKETKFLNRLNSLYLKLK